MKASTYQLPAVLAVFSVIVSAMPASAQLPPVNWGKSVHGPGDNQYGGDQQGMRHPPNTTPTRPQFIPSGGGGGGAGPIAFRPTPRRPKPDISLQPIPADEPVPPSGFPPLPDRLDLPGIDNTTAFNATSMSGGGGGGGGPMGGGGGGGGGAAPNPFQGKKQGYAHFEPGAFSGQTRNNGMPSGGGGGGGGDFHQNYNHAAPGSSAPAKSVGYYKCQEAPLGKKPVVFEESFGSDAGTKPPAYAGASAADLKKLGREPKLNDRQNGGDSQPEAPTPVSINQASTQDLSLPDDEFRARRPKSKTGKVFSRIGQRIGNRAGAMMNQGLNMAGVSLRSR